MAKFFESLFLRLRNSCCRVGDVPRLHALLIDSTWLIQIPLEQTEYQMRIVNINKVPQSGTRKGSRIPYTLRFSETVTSLEYILVNSLCDRTSIDVAHTRHSKHEPVSFTGLSTNVQPILATEGPSHRARFGLPRMVEENIIVT
jgi:hypothetical protein